MNTPILCLVTIHGVGFQQPPQSGLPGYPDRAGYADGLHEHLSNYLDETLLSDDPLRQRERPGQNGPIYVQSAWPPGTLNREAGLSRLGSWDADHSGIVIDPQTAPLVNGKGKIAHVALVYTRLQEQGGPPGAALTAGAMALASLEHYTTTSNLVRTFLLDMKPFWQYILHPQEHKTPLSQCVRNDPGINPPPGGLNGLRAILRQLEDDVAAYVCHNAMRERVRGFVQEALTRLAMRDDVGSIIVNAHSNGSVIARDVLHKLPLAAANKITTFITSGSPLRKYNDLFHWGAYVEHSPQAMRWFNILDPRDPVADPLAPSASWIRGTEPSDLRGLYKALDAESGQLHDIQVEDKLVDNIANSASGGLQAHNYWDNKPEFVSPLSDLLKQLAIPSNGEPEQVPAPATQTALQPAQEK